MIALAPSLVIRSTMRSAAPAVSTLCSLVPAVQDVRVEGARGHILRRRAGVHNFS